MAESDGATMVPFGSHGWSPDHFGEQIREWGEAAVQTRKIRTLSLFTGAGGLDIGFHDAGFDIVEMVEIDKRFCATLHRNTLPDGHFGSGKVACVDIRDYSANQVNGAHGHVDLIIGGPPCQTFSAAGRRAAGVAGTTEHRGTLFAEYVRLLKVLKPLVFVFENVAGITGSADGRDWKIIRKAFASAGYELHGRLLDSADYGVPQHRERMFLVGVKSGTFAFPRPTHGPDSRSGVPHFTPRDALGNVLPKEQLELLQLEGRHADLLPQIPPGLNYSYFTEKMGHPRPLFAWRSKFSDFLYKADPEVPVRTIKAQCGQCTGPFHWDSRRFTVSEMKRLQTFPDTYHLEGTRGIALKQIGNSVPPQMARILALSILDQVFGVAPPIPLVYMPAGESLGFRTRQRAFSSHYKTVATTAIEMSKFIPQKLPPHQRRVKVGLSPSFEMLVDSENSDHDMEFTFVPGESLEVLVTADRRRTKPAFSVHIQPHSGTSWIVPAKSIFLQGTEVSTTQFTLAWKGLAHWLRANGLLDDVVQLAGYYAYEPSIACTLDVSNDAGWKWCKLADIVSGIGVRRPLPQADLASHLQMPLPRVPQLIKFLRHLGYEVRSEKTNPQLSDNCFLIPYCFPTLTRESVQRHKCPLT